MKKYKVKANLYVNDVKLKTVEDDVEEENKKYALNVFFDNMLDEAEYNKLLTLQEYDDVNYCIKCFDKENNKYELKDFTVK